MTTWTNLDAWIVQQVQIWGIKTHFKYCIKTLISFQFHSNQWVEFKKILVYMFLNHLNMGYSLYFIAVTLLLINLLINLVANNIILYTWRIAILKKYVIKK